MGAFQTGFGMGAQMFWQAQALKDRELERQRQDRLDEQRTKESNQRMEATQLQIDAAKRENADRQELRDLAKPTTVEQGFAADGASGKVYAADPAQAQQAADINAAAEEMAAGPEGDQGGVEPTGAVVKPASGVRGGGMLAIGAAGLKAQDLNDPEARAERIAQWYDGRDPVKAMQYRETAAAWKQKKYEAGRTHIYQTGLGALAKDGPAGLVKLYDSYDDGHSARFDPDGKGGGTISRLDKDGNVVGGFAFKDNDDLALKWRDVVYPDKRADALAAARQKAAEEAGKGYVLKPGESRYVGTTKVAENNGLKPGFEWVTNANGELVQARVGSGGKGGKQPGEFDELDDLFKASAQESETKLPTAADVASAHDMARRIFRYGGVPASTAVRAAIRAQSDPKAQQTVISGAGDFVSTVDVDGRPVVVNKFDPAKVDPKVRQSAVAGMVDDLFAGRPQQERARFLRAAFDRTGPGGSNSTLAEMNTELLQAVRDRVMAKPENAALPKEAIEAQVKRDFDRAASALKRKLDLVGLYGDRNLYRGTGLSDQGRTHNKEEQSKIARLSDIDSAARNVLSAKDPEERMRLAAEVQGHPLFNQLDRKTQAAIFGAANGR